MNLRSLVQRALTEGSTTQKELAERLGVSQGLVSRMAGGYIPTEKATLLKVVQGLVPPEDVTETLEETSGVSGEAIQASFGASTEFLLPPSLCTPEPHKLLEEGLALWRGLLTSDPEARNALEQVLRRTAEVLPATKTEKHAKERDVLVSHAAKVLRYAYGLGVNRRAGGPRRGSAASIVTPDGAVLVISATLAHVLCLDPSLDSDGERDLSYPQRAASFADRIGRWFGPGSREGERFVAMELFRDSPYWTKSVEESQRSQAAQMSPRVLFASRLLRMSDALDVPHRYVPDLMTEIFSRLRFPEGLDLYFRGTFGERGLLTEEDAILDGSTVRLRCATIPRSLSAPGAAYAFLFEAQQHAQKIVRDQLQASLRDIAANDPFLDGGISRLPHEVAPGSEDHAGGLLPRLFVTSENLHAPWEARRVEQLAWALAPLAIALQGSDSDAELAALSLVPLLAQHLQSEMAARGNPNELDGRTRDLLKVYISRLAALRQQSAALAQISELLLDDGTARVDSGKLAEVMALIPKRGRDWKGTSLNMPPGHDLVVFVFGLSRPVARYLASAAKILRERDRTLRVYPIYCMRSYQRWADSDRDQTLCPPQHTDLIVPEDQSQAMERALSEALREQEIPSSVLKWSPTIDAFRIPKIFYALASRGCRFELVFGARMFSLEPMPNAITIFGCHSLALMCGGLRIDGLGIQRRLVTWHDRLANPSVKFNQLDSWFTYSIVPTPDSENERVPFDCIDFVSTENQEFEGQLAAEMLKQSGSSVPPPAKGEAVGTG